MLLTCFKHDFKSLSRTLVPVLIAIGAAALYGFINTIVAIRSIQSDAIDANPVMGVLTASAFGGILVVAMLLAAALTVFAVLIFVRFYRSMVTDEAYLTFTLPVPASKLVASKFLSSLVWMIFGGIAVAAAGFILLWGVAIAQTDVSVAEALKTFFGFFFDILRNAPVTFFLALLYALTAALRTYFQITSAILFGASIVRKNKALAAVGMVLGVNFLVSTVLSIVGVTAFLPRLFIVSTYGVMDSTRDAHIWLWIQIAVNAALTALFWWLSVRIAKKSVNIE